MTTNGISNGSSKSKGQPTQTQTPGKWSDLPTRLTTISLGIPILWAIWSHPVLRTLFFQAVHLGCCLEFSRLTRAQHVWLFPVLSTLLVNISTTSSSSGNIDYNNNNNNNNNNDTLFHAGLVLTAAGTSLVLSGGDAVQQTILMQGLFLLTLPFRSWLIVSDRPTTGFGDVVNVLLTVWNTDTGALLTGRFIGNRVTYIPESWRGQLRRVSPNKSVEGLLGGIGLGVFSHQCFMPGIFWLLKHYAPAGVLPPLHQSSLESKLWIGILLSLAALWGDLYESCIKRQYHIKDAGHLIPGHGGILDRFDSSLIAIVLYHALTTIL